jgi:triphosphoribosyl-dephospho-CoA synthase
VPPPVGLCAQIACIWEVMARKPGNVHPSRDFADASCLDFLGSAAVIGPVLQSAYGRPVGQTVLEGVRAMQQVVGTNTNLGILLLLAPLAAVPPQQWLREGAEQLLEKLDLQDSRDVFEAIRLAKPGGLGKAPLQDVHDEPTLPLREVMALAADRDLIARQYANGFQELFTTGVPALVDGLRTTRCLEDAVIFCHLRLMSALPDSLIARKQGQAEAEEASRRAVAVLNAGWPGTEAGRTAFAALDAWLRVEGNRRNPGTTADLVAACLFVALRDGLIALPPSLPWR